MSKRMEGPRWGWIVLTIWGVFALLPIIYFASIALRPRNEIIAPVPIYFPTLTTETWQKIWTEWPIGLYFFLAPMRWRATSSEATPTSATTSSPPK
jgi:ABC-type glycerol-3-phosphate transport system permease component